MLTTDLPGDGQPTQPDRSLALSIWSDVSLVDDGNQLSISPRGIPLGFAWVCIAVPLAAAAIFLYLRLSRGIDEWALVPFFVLGPLAAFIFLRIVKRINERAGAGVAVAVLDRNARTLTLCDQGVTLAAGSISGLELIRSTKKFNFGGEITWSRISELFVVAKSGNEMTDRLLVISCGRRKHIERFAEEIARSLGVDLRRAKD